MQESAAESRPNAVVADEVEGQSPRRTLEHKNLQYEASPSRNEGGGVSGSTPPRAGSLTRDGVCG